MRMRRFVQNGMTTSVNATGLKRGVRLAMKKESGKPAKAQSAVVNPPIARLRRKISG